MAKVAQSAGVGESGGWGGGRGILSTNRLIRQRIAACGDPRGLREGCAEGGALRQGWGGGVARRTAPHLISNPLTPPPLTSPHLT